MEFLFGLIIVVGLCAIFYVTVHKKTRSEFTDHIKSAEVVMSEVQQEIQCIEEAAIKLASIAEEAAIEVKEIVAVKVPKSAKAAVAETRARTSGKFVGDDKSTTEVNEAYKDGKKSEKTAKKPSGPKSTGKKKVK